MKLLVDDEAGSGAAEALWFASDFLLCAETGYAEGRAALAAMHRAGRLTPADFTAAKAGFESLWTQIEIVAVDRDLVAAAGELAERNRLRGYDSVHLAAALATNVDVFASSDHRLIAAAEANGLATSDPAG